MDRREAMLRVAALTGLTLSAPLLSGLLVSCDSGSKTTEAQKKPREVSGKHRTMVEEIAERIIPKTGTPGAKEAGVPAFVLTTLADCYPEKDQDTFFKGLDQLDADAKKAYNNSFLDLKAAEQTALLVQTEKTFQERKTKSRQEAEAAKKSGAKYESPALEFFQIMKELTIVGYFSSEPGATQALAYVQVPGAYQACTDMKPGQKTWAM
ncbi:MAG: gluconate 2-dehydrogenase subunit 3 family protein [Adhaeribacter sp.]